ncbi:MAG: PspC domain-containing protein [Bacteroidetes bacterium]|nr:PspC domain-containing protein [Bacteroidota bacterium]
MKKTININLAGMAFIIDENAYEVLHNYLEALRHKFSNETERAEILNDIEARMAEMLAARNTMGKQVVNIDDVNEVIAIMGKPEDIAGDEEQTQTTQQRPEPATAPVKKRLFRDPDDKKVSGVISGLCHYFGVDDPVWLRLIFVGLCFLSFGTMIILYLILMIVIPEADTAAEKLQMKGEPVNVSTIEKEIKDGANRAAESLRDFTSGNTLFEKIGHLLLTILVGIAKVVVGVIAFAGLFALAVLIASLFGLSIVGGGLFTQVPNILFDGANTIFLFKLGLILFFGSIVSVAVYSLVRLVFGKRTQVRPLKWVLLATWWAGVFLLILAGFKVGNSYKASATIKEEVALMQPPAGHLVVQLSDTSGNRYAGENDQQDTHDNWNISLFGFEVNGEDVQGLDKITIGEPSLQLIPSPNDSFYVYTFTSSRGSNKEDAHKNSSYLVYKVMQTDSVVSLPALLLLDGKGKWRAQSMKIRIAIPEGKQVSFADNIDNWAATVKGNAAYDDTYFNNTTWTTEGGKVKCLRGENHFMKEEEAEDVEVNKGKSKEDDYYHGTVDVKKEGENVKVHIQDGTKQKVITIDNTDGKEEVKEVLIEKK